MIFVNNDDVMGKNIRYLRQRENITLEEFAQRIGLSVSALNAIETGECREIKGWVLNLICDYFSTDIQTLVEKKMDNAS